jgi:putative ABC transport system ATP-binding protein
VAIVVGSVVKLGKSLESYYDLMAAVDKLGHLTDLPLERGAGEVELPANGPARVRLQGVEFAYPDQPSRPVLRDLHLEVAPGERVALVGPGGGGKSTVADLLFGLRGPRQGRVELDGVDLRDLHPEVLREHVATVGGQEVFAGTVEENVRLGREGLSPAAVRGALAAASLLDEVQALPDGLRTQLATGGAPLSDGQAQRLVLARALAARPRLLVLDETLDGFDLALRARLADTVLDRSAPWTLVLITNDPELARRCDRRVTLPGPAAGRPILGPNAGERGDVPERFS